jgi:hypothetical protein
MMDSLIFSWERNGRTRTATRTATSLGCGAEAIVGLESYVLHQMAMSLTDMGSCRNFNSDCSEFHCSDEHTAATPDASPDFRSADIRIAETVGG